MPTLSPCSRARPWSSRTSTRAPSSRARPSGRRLPGWPTRSSPSAPTRASTRSGTSTASSSASTRAPARTWRPSSAVGSTRRRSPRRRRVAAGRASRTATYAGRRHVRRGHRHAQRPHQPRPWSRGPATASGACSTGSRTESSSRASPRLDARHARDVRALEIALAADLATQPVAAAAFGSVPLPWLDGMRVARIIGELRASPG